MAKRHAAADVVASVVVPTYKEKANLRPLTTRLFKAIDASAVFPTAGSVELIVVDDNSRDGSEEEIATLAAEGFRVRIIVRTKERGLSSAVIRGFQEAKGKIIMCMDADLQHPPEMVPELLKAALVPDVDFVIGTRYAPGVSIDASWPLYRRVISNGARMLARPLTPLSDPMTGFFAMKKAKFDKAKDVNPIGFKICLELYVKANCASSREVPFSFGVREHGVSKLTGAVMVRYLEQLWQLYLYKKPTILLGLLAFIAVAGFIALYLILLLTK